MGKLEFKDFISSVDEENRDFVNELHLYLTEQGCKIEVKEAKSGFMVSYLYDKKTIANYVFRKSGVIIRIYANNIVDYMDFLNTLPQNMIEKIKDAPVCKRLINPEACNSKCAMGYDFILKDERQQKCRISAFMFLLCKENNPYIRSFMEKELESRKI